MKILVTGANGLLGANVVRELLNRGADVRVLVRQTCNLLPLDGLPVGMYYGDITNKNNIDNAVQDCDIVIHIAAVTCQDYPKLKSYLPVNVTATELIIEAVEKYAVSKFIYVSTAAVFGYGSEDNPGSECDPIQFPFNKIHYVQSKLRAQNLVIKAAKALPTKVVIVNPTFMIGAYDSKPSSGQIILMVLGKKFVLVPPGGKNFIHVRDVAIGVCNAIRYGVNGECYILSNQNLSFKEFFGIVVRESHIKSILISIPKPVLLFLGVVGSLLTAANIRISLSYYNALAISTSNFYSNKKSVKKLHMPTTPIEDAVSESVRWFKENGYLSKMIYN